MKRVLRTTVIAVLLAALCVPRPAHAGETIRVLVMEGLKRLSIRFPASYDVQDFTSGVVMPDGQGGSIIMLEPGTRIDGGIRVRADGSVIKINEFSLTGNIDIRKDGQGKYSVVNELDIEDYTRAVVGEEMDPRWPLEALKAQAVAARTYALYRKRKAACGEYDLCSTTNSQMFTGDGRFKEGPAIAVDATRGLVLSKDGRLIEPVFHSCCGGRTEDSANVWDNPHSYLKSVDCICAPGTPYDQWTRKIKLPDIVAALRSNGYPAIGLNSLTVAERSPSGRANLLEAGTPRGKFTIKGAEFRKLVGYRELPSTYLVVNPYGAGFLFTGTGSGHGVGMCQWGAKAMAEAGSRYYEILAHYYPGVELERTGRVGGAR